ncbi:hypothetical protein ARMSODRAFT_1028140 [Armillaria solidipes]|uniref:NGN domain-containing protein n=1 Tax=Armillaria solidipes TaxID=1076256 RepID=A0A2H3ALH7_9AGAR|nr:hypothetical protein ARMSODRAFT_1028140 [Armillaria solidipes]
MPIARSTLTDSDPKALSEYNRFLVIDGDDSSTDEDVSIPIHKNSQNHSLDAVKNRSLSRRTETCGIHRDIYHPDHEQWLQELLDSSKMLRPASRMPFRTMTKFAGLMPEDWALWKVKCKLGEEEFVVVSLLASVTSEHQVRSAFVPVVGRRWVYLETTKPAALQTLLKSTLGVIQVPDSGGLKLLPVPREEWLAMLSSNRKVIERKVGTWVYIRTGKMKGAVGVVSGRYTWGVSILLIPRIHDNPDFVPKDLKKRKRDPPLPPSRLFDVAHVKAKYGESSVKRHQQCPHLFYFLGGWYHYDLCIVDRPLTGVGLAGDIPLEVTGLFLRSQHPLLKEAVYFMPRPAEWHFHVADYVFVTSISKEGTIWELTPNTIEVEYADGTGLHTVSYQDVHKIFKTGDFVEVQKEKVGWVQYMDSREPAVEILEQIYDINTGLKANLFSAHANSLRKIRSPTFHPQPTIGSDAKFSFDVCSGIVPWKGVPVTARRSDCGPAKNGIISDVFRGQPTASGLKLLVRLEPETNGQSLTEIICDYDDVTELVSSLPLLAYLPLRYSQRAFLPLRSYHDLRLAPYTTPLQLIPKVWDGAYPAVPDEENTCHEKEIDWAAPECTINFFPGCNSHSTPVTLPSPTVKPNDPVSPFHLSPSPSIAANDAAHWSLNCKLKGLGIRVYLDNIRGKNKDVVVTLELHEGRLQLRKKNQRSRVTIDPNRISPIHPRTRDYGRWVVIQGEHCGKHVRAIQFKRLSKEKLEWELFVVVPRNKEIDMVTGEEIYVSHDSLCLAPESVESKQLNKPLAQRRKGSRDV